MTLKLPDLPYPLDALEPYISQKTLEFHYGKHHQAYLNTLNQLILGTPFEGQPLERIIRESGNQPEKISVFNNAAQVWNHTFFWNSLKPAGQISALSGPLKTALEKTFGSLHSFHELFKQAALTQFGSGWVWLGINKSGDLTISKTSNADLPLLRNETPLLVCDVWEHAYYLDYQNKRADYVDAFLTHLLNWSFAEENFLNA